MSTTTSSCLLRFLLSLVVRLSRLSPSAGHITLALRRWSAWLWRYILSLPRRSGHSQIRLHANDAPVGSNPIAENSQHANRVEEVREHGVTLATTPVQPNVSWQDELSRLRALTSIRFLELLDPLPSTPERCSQRYKPRTVNYGPDTRLEIPAGQKKLLLSLPPLPDGWRRHVHPEGVVLFYHERLRVFTESNICDRRKEEEILFCAMKLLDKANQTDDVTLNELTEIVINVDDSRRWHYYFVDHTNRLLFWVDTVNVREIAIDMQGISDYNHIKYMVEAYYWYASPTNPLGMLYIVLYNMELRSHCEYYPHNHALPQKSFEDLKGILNYARIDIITTDSSSSPFGQDELVAMLDLVNSLGDDKKISDPYSIWAIARLMAYFTENQFLNFCGQPYARLNADTPLFGKQDWNHRPLFQTINLFLLGSPNEHALRLQRVWVDGIIIQPRWKDFVNRLTTELGRYTIFSTVMLAVNFSFLSVPGVVTPHSAAGPIQIIIYCSVVSTVASIVFSFGLLNVYNNPRLLIARNALEAIWTLSQTKTGMASLAITHSLPIAFLIWSIALFTAALAVQIFRPGEPATVATLSIEFAIIVWFAVVGTRVMQLFTQNDDGDDADPSTERTLPPPVSEGDIEQGPGN